MSDRAERDFEKNYPLPDFIDKLRRLADALETKQRFQIQIAGERVSVPVRASYNIEHERGEDEEEIEFQIKWSSGISASRAPGFGLAPFRRALALPSLS